MNAIVLQKVWCIYVLQAAVFSANIRNAQTDQYSATGGSIRMTIPIKPTPLLDIDVQYVSGISKQQSVFKHTKQRVSVFTITIVWVVTQRC